LKKYAPEKEIILTPIPRLTWKEAMSKYGTDKPDLRFGLEIQNITDLAAQSNFKVFSDAAARKEVIYALCVSGGAKFSRRELDEFEEIAKSHGAKGLIYMIYENGEIKSPILKYIEQKEVDAITKKLSFKEGDVVLICAAPFKTACEALGDIRLKCGNKLGLIDKNKFALVWIVEFPLFEWSEEEGKLVSSHHPFTSPMYEDYHLLDTDPASVRAKAYDLVLNGVEIAGGSIRIYDPTLQRKIFDILKITADEAKIRFGHLLKAFEYGPPPHGGIAWGLDRFIMMIREEPNIREVIAFPKDQKAKDLMTGAPSQLPDEQIAEMHIKIAKKP